MPKNAARPKVVAIDGPAGSGKSTIASEVCARTGWIYLSTGLLYRTVGVIGGERGIHLDDEKKLGELIDEFNEKLRWDSETGAIYFDGEDVTARLSTAQAGPAASRVAKLPLVRQKLLPVQRNFVAMSKRGVIMDGRDIGTVVFPDADLKVFMTASLEERAKRRLLQLNASSELLGDFIRDISKRDEQDSKRANAPLKQADDAIALDTTNLTMQEVVESVIRLMRQRHLID